MEVLIKLIIFLPLISAAFVGLQTASIADKKAQILSSMFVSLAAIFSWVVFFDVAIEGNTYLVTLLEWISVGSFSVDWALRVDSLTAVMLVVVNTVSSIVHIYSIGYMSHDPHKPRFMAYLSLFTFSMLMLVTADNFIQLFFGWEGVGLCSYLLIGFWFKKPEANAAAQKAFVVNRVADVAMALGVAAIFLAFNSVQFNQVFSLAENQSHVPLEFFGYYIPTLELICVLLFIGAMGKSAQLFLHTWLPDAMEGPTPVSALIHAATMVTAGVFLVARCSPMFEHAPGALMMVTVVGALTAFFAATVALTQNDIKKVIAYSTCSQLGYMFFACGVSAYSAAIFHLGTHAFFKALLFLCAGSVIHAMGDEQDMRKMGGIYKKIPYTYAFMWIGSLALAGLPFFAGFYSKDIILEAAYASHTPVGQFAFWMGLAAATLTAFYSWRLIYMTFHGTSRASAKTLSHVHESPKVMLLPLYILVAGSLFAGFAGYKIGMVDESLDFWNGSIFMLDDKYNILAELHHVPQWVIAAPIVVGLLGILLATKMYLYSPTAPARVAKFFSRTYKFLSNKWYFDELYNFIFVRTHKKISDFSWKQIDVKIIDNLGPNGFASLAHRFAATTSKLQTGFIYHYSFAVVVGLLLLMWIVLYKI